jgi:predicted secreted protein
MSNKHEALAAEYLRRLAKEDMRAWRRTMSDVAIAEENTSEQKEAVRLLRRVRSSKRAES